MIRRDTLIAFSLTGGLILFLAAGSGIYPWTVWLITLLLFAPLISNWIGRRRAETPPGTFLSALPFLLVMGYLMLMILPLPLPLTLLGGIPRYQENAIAVDMVKTIHGEHLLDEGPRTLWFALTRNRAGTLRIILYALMCFTVYESARRCGRHAHRLLWAMATIGATAAVLGLLGKWLWPQGNTLWWFLRVPRGLPGPMGGFINPNHYAGFVSLSVAISAALLVHAVFKRRWPLILAATLLLTVCLGGTLLSLSRGGLLASAAALGLLCVIALRHTPVRVRLVALLLPLLLAAGLFIVAGRAPTVATRLLELRHPTTSASGHDRLAAWHSSLGIFVRYPVFGAGPNGFRCTYPMHRKHGDEQAYRTFAENEYIQLLCDCGLLGVALAAMLLVTIIRPIIWRSGTRSPPVLAASAVLAAVAVHALFEFALHLPAYLFVVALTLGLAAAQTDKRPAARIDMAAITTTALLLLLLAPAALSHRSQRDSPGRISGMSAPQLTRALGWAPTDANIWEQLGARLPRNTAGARLRRECLEQASTYDPLRVSLLVMLAEARLAAGDRTGAKEAAARAIEVRSWAPLSPELRSLMPPP